MGSAALTEVSLSTVVIYVRDLERMATFYRDTLGLSVRHQTESYVELGAKGGADIALHTGRTTDGDQGQWFVEFRMSDIEAVVRDLRSRGVEVGGISERAWGKEAAFTDPEGTRIELEQPAEERD